MRAKHDPHTAELPGIEAVPVFRRGTVPERKRLMAYQAPKVRPHCATCAHCEISDTRAGYEVLVCELGGFNVQRLSVCKNWALPDDPSAH